MTTNTCKHLVAYFNANTNAKQTLIIDKEKFSGLKADSVRRYCLELTKNGEATKNEDGTYTLNQTGCQHIIEIIEDANFFGAPEAEKQPVANTTTLKPFSLKILNILASFTDGASVAELMACGFAQNTVRVQMSRIRCAGVNIETFKRDGSTCYRLATA